MDARSLSRLFGASLFRFVGGALAGLTASEAREPIRKVLEQRLSAGKRLRLADQLEAAARALRAGETATASKALAEAVGDFQL